jgi:S1-C subfamily serine protease
MAWHKVYEKVKPYVVRISTQDGFGTGFLFAYNKDHSLAAIATAAHVVKQARDWRQPLKITHYASGETVFFSDAERVIWLDTSRDAATIIIPSKMFKFPTSTLQLMDSTKFKKIGVEVAWVGFPNLAANSLCFFSGQISSFVPEDDSYLIDGVAINGVSGGPVFNELDDSTPELIGLVSAYMANRRATDTLPGLLRAQDVTSFHTHIKMMKDLDDAKEKEHETQTQIDKETKPVPNTALEPTPTAPSVSDKP